MPAYNSSTPCSDWSGCTRCRLHATRRTVITRRSGLITHGVITHDVYWSKPRPVVTDHHTPVLGNSHRVSFLPHALFIGEAPGELEDMLGLTFWGPAGNILDKILIECSKPHPGHKFLKPEQTELRIKYGPTNFYFTLTNTVCCRPVHTADTTPSSKLWGRNRQPTDAEINSCKPHILELFQNPFPITHVVCLGEVANKAYNSLGLPQPALHLLHPAFIARMDYQHLPIIKQAESLRTWIRNKH